MARRVGTAAMTTAERQARRRRQYNDMRDALEAIERAATVASAKAIAAAVLDRLGRQREDAAA